MAEGNNRLKKNRENNEPQEQAEVHTNPRLWIKKVRTYEEDLKEAKARAGAKEDAPAPPKKKKSFFERKVKLPKPPKPPKKLKPKKLSGLDKKFIERELERSGIVAQKPPPEQKEEERKKTSVPVIRTFKHDVAASVKENNISQVGMAVAEQERRAREHDFTEFTDGASTIFRNIALVAVSIVLIVSGTYAGWYFYKKNQLPPAPRAETARDILFTNESQEVVIGRLSGTELMELLDERSGDITGANGILVEFSLIETGVLGEEKVSKNNLFERISGIPTRLIRALENNFIIGVHARAVGNAPFFLLKTSDFETAFAAMLDWEETMQRDLSPLFGSTEGIGDFEDVLIRNKDARILKDAFFGNTTLLYAFPNTDTIVLTTNEETFFEIFERLTTVNTVRN